MTNYFQLSSGGACLSVQQKYIVISAFWLCVCSQWVPWVVIVGWANNKVGKEQRRRTKLVNNKGGEGFRRCGFFFSSSKPLGSSQQPIWTRAGWVRPIEPNLQQIFLPSNRIYQRFSSGYENTFPFKVKDGVLWTFRKCSLSVSLLFYLVLSLLFSLVHKWHILSSVLTCVLSMFWVVSLSSECSWVRSERTSQKWPARSWSCTIVHHHNKSSRRS